MNELIIVEEKVKNLNIETFVEAVKNKLSDELEIAKTMIFIEVTDKETKETADNQALVLKATKVKVENLWSQLKTAANAFHKKVVAEQKKITDDLDFAIKFREQKVGAYIFAEQKKAQALMDEQRKKAAQDGKVIPFPVPNPVLDSKGVKKPWQCEIYDPLELLKAIVEKKAPLAILESVVEKLKITGTEFSDMDKMATTYKMEKPWPGVRAKEIMRYNVR